jgi:hypothetical protein
MLRCNRNVAELAMSNSITWRTMSRTESRLKIDAESCPTCNEARFILLRGKSIVCPTCCSTIRRGELYLPAGKPRRTRRRAKFIVIAVATSVLALWSGVLTLH